MTNFFCKVWCDKHNGKAQGGHGKKMKKKNERIKYIYLKIIYINFIK